MQVLKDFDQSRFWIRLDDLSSDGSYSGDKESLDHLRASVRNVASRAKWINSQVESLYGDPGLCIGELLQVERNSFLLRRQTNGMNSALRSLELQLRLKMKREPSVLGHWDFTAQPCSGHDRRGDQELLHADRQTPLRETQ